MVNQLCLPYICMARSWPRIQHTLLAHPQDVTRLSKH